MIKYIDKNIRIKYSFVLKYLGKCYRLQRKRKFFGWKTVAWTYPTTHDTYEDMISYLFWYENKYNHIPFYKNNN